MAIFRNMITAPMIRTAWGRDVDDDGDDDDNDDDDYHEDDDYDNDNYLISTPSIQPNLITFPFLISTSSSTFSFSFN